MSTVFEMLDAEWRRLCSDRVAARRLHDVCQLANAARTLSELERFVRSAGAAEADRVLLALVARASIEGASAVGIAPSPTTCGSTEALAARVLLQLLLPGTRSMARRWWALGDPQERAAAAVAAVYDRIRCYPLARRPGRVAANILLDAERQLRRAAAGAAITPVADPSVHHAHGAHQANHAHDVGYDIGPSPHPAIELTEVLRDAVHDRIIDPGDAELIARSRIAGERVVDIAHRRGAHARTLWDRRQRAEHALVSTAHQRRAAS